MNPLDRSDVATLPTALCKSNDGRATCLWELIAVTQRSRSAWRRAHHLGGHLRQDGVVTSTPTADDPRELTLDDFPVHRSVMTRWSDNDMYGHLNNAVYYELFDSAINGWQAEHVGVEPLSDTTKGVVAESGCVFYGEVAFPAPLVVGLRVVRLGTSSVTYQLGLFVDATQASPPDHRIKALGHWVHVEIDATTRRPTPLPDLLRELLDSVALKGVS